MVVGQQFFEGDESARRPFSGDGKHCRFCGEPVGELAPHSAEYITFWNQHESREHKRECLVNAIDEVALEDIVRVIITELI